MLSVYIQEQRYYTLDELGQLFKCKDKDRVLHIWQRLESKGLAKLVKREAKDKDLTELAQSDAVEIKDGAALEDCLFVCTFVGVIIIGDVALKCYPKYIKAKEPTLEQMCLIMQVLNKYNNRSQELSFYAMDEKQHFNTLTVMLALLFDYYQYGLYTKEQLIREINGNGEILWEPTVNNSLVLFNNNRPIYTELITRRRVTDDESFIRRVHAWVLMDCSATLAEAELLDLFALSPVEEACCELDELGDMEYIAKRLQQEMCSQFNTRKQQLLQLLKAYIEKENLRSEASGISAYGTVSFNMAWEKACASAFGNVLDSKCCDLGIALQGRYDKGSIRALAFKEIIDRPEVVTAKKEDEKYYKSDANLLKPDIVALTRNEDTWRMDIFDAKYYLARVDEDGTAHNLPGIGDITKEFLYELAYKEFRDTHGISMGKNAFVFPSEGEERVLVAKGEIIMKMFRFYEPKLQPITLLFADANKVFECYVKGTRLSNTCFE